MAPNPRTKMKFLEHPNPRRRVREHALAFAHAVAFPVTCCLSPMALSVPVACCLLPVALPCVPSCPPWLRAFGLDLLLTFQIINYKLPDYRGPRHARAFCAWWGGGYQFSPCSL